MAELTGVEPAVSCVTGRHVRPLHHSSSNNYYTQLSQQRQADKFRCLVLNPLNMLIINLELFYLGPRLQFYVVFIDFTKKIIANAVTSPYDNRRLDAVD